MTDEVVRGGAAGDARPVAEIEVLDLDVPTADVPPQARPTAPSERPGWRRAGVVGPVCGVLGLLVGYSAAAPAAGPPATATSTASGTATSAPTTTVTETVTDPGATVTEVVTDRTGAGRGPAPAIDIGEDGTYLVGIDLEPGEYVTVGHEACAWSRLSATDGRPASVIVANSGGGPQVVTIAPEDRAFQTRNCGSWVKVVPTP